MRVFVWALAAVALVFLISAYLILLKPFYLPVAPAAKEKPNQTAAEEKILVEELPKKIVKEGELVAFPNLKAKDPDGDPLTYYFSSPLNASGQWQTKQGDAGTYRVTITASDGKINVSQDILIIVEPANRPPVLHLAQKEIRVKAGDVVKIFANASDPDGDAVRFAFSGWMQSSEKNTSAEDIGSHEVIITASDGKSSVEERVIVLVEKPNAPPKLLALKDISVLEGEFVKVVPTAFDPDGDRLSFSFSSPLNAKGEWQTAAGDAGEYVVNVKVSDGQLEDVVSLKIKVLKPNSPPELLLEQAYTFDENSTIEIEFSVFDADGDKILISASGWLADADVTIKGENGNYTAVLKKFADFESAGQHEIKLIASDGKAETAKTFTLKINNVNRPPVFLPGSFA